ncbi:hypothetical protein C8R42DRAFT_644298 [Lentinula raphanica]|nr:hypothetical protein C8R42DRAFT_644298 [Lentinula raphanica]
MRSRTIYVFYVAITLLAAASVAASPLPPGAQSSESSKQKTKSVSIATIRFGLLDVEKGEEKPVDLDAGFSERLNARYLTCFGSEICFYYVHPGPGPGSVGFTKPQLLNQAQPRLVPRTGPKKEKRNDRVDRYWYEKLYGVALRSSRLSTETRREIFNNQLNAACNSEPSMNTISAFHDEVSLIFSVFKHLKSAFIKDPAELADGDLRKEIASLLDTLKAADTDQYFLAYAAFRRSERDLRGDYRSMAKSEASQTMRSGVQDSMTGDTPSESSWPQNPPVGSNSYNPKSNLAEPPSSSSHEKHDATFTSTAHWPHTVSSQPSDNTNTKISVQSLLN